MKKIIKQTLLKPPYVKWCSQTIYQALLGCIKIFEVTRDGKWEARAKELLNILFEIQQKDGGFDIGYDFNFGMLHKKGESTSPEMVGLLALVEYGRVFGFSDDLNKKCYKAVQWITDNAVAVDGDEFYAPYAPYSTKNVMVYNGTSFVCGALGYYLGIVGDKDPKLIAIYEGMVKYLQRNLTYSKNPEGAFWYYYDQKRKDIHSLQKLKIDNYHQMQQVEMHAYAQSVYPLPLQLSMIDETSQYILNVFSEQGTVPYTNNPKDFGGGIHLWGFSSIISGLVMAKKVGVLIDDSNVNSLILFVQNFILDKGWNGQYFCPIVSKNGLPLMTDYMVRSDAWVFNSLASLLSVGLPGSNNEVILGVLSKCYNKMCQANFSGKETHASNKRTRVIASLINKLR